MKTIDEILEMAATTLYLRQADYNRNLAITLFLKDLEQKAKEKNIMFLILNTHVIKMQCRHLRDPKASLYDWPEPDPTTEVKTFTYARFAYGNETFYMQFDDNPFFEAYMKRNSEIIHHEAYRKEELHEIETGHIRIFGDVEVDVLWKYNGMKNIEILKKHLHKKFNELNEKPKHNFWKSHKKELNQIIYTR